MRVCMRGGMIAREINRTQESANLVPDIGRQVTSPNAPETCYIILKAKFHVFFLFSEFVGDFESVVKNMQIQSFSPICKGESIIKEAFEISIRNSNLKYQSLRFCNQFIFNSYIFLSQDSPDNQFLSANLTYYALFHVKSPIRFVNLGGATWPF